MYWTYLIFLFALMRLGCTQRSLNSATAEERSSGVQCVWGQIELAERN